MRWFWSLSMYKKNELKDSHFISIIGELLSFPGPLERLCREAALSCKDQFELQLLFIFLICCSETSNWIAANTRECPKCHVTIEKDGGCNHMVRSRGWVWLKDNPNGCRRPLILFRIGYCRKTLSVYCWSRQFDWKLSNFSKYKSDFASFVLLIGLQESEL